MELAYTFLCLSDIIVSCIIFQVIQDMEIIKICKSVAPDRSGLFFIF